MSALVELYVREVSSREHEDRRSSRQTSRESRIRYQGREYHGKRGGLMWSAVFIFLVKILFGKEVLQMLVRLYAGEVILEKITIDDVPRGLRERVKAYLVEMGYIDAQ